MTDTKKKILIVEDHPTLREALRRLLVVARRTDHVLVVGQRAGPTRSKPCC